MSLNYQSKVAKLAPNIFLKMIKKVELVRGYRIFVFSKSTEEGVRETAYGNRGSLNVYNSKPYIVGNFVITGLDERYFKSDRTLDIFFGNDILLYFHSEIEILPDSRIYVDRGNYFTDNGDKYLNQFDLNGLDYDYREISSVNKMQCFMVDDIMNRMGYGKEIIQILKIIPTEMPTHLE